MTARAFDVLVVGSGAAGLTAALNLATTLKVGVIAKGKLSEGATGWAQGGIAAVLEEGDSFEAHVRDTMIAGAGLNNLAVVEHVVSEAPAGDRPAERAGRAVRHREWRAAPDPRGRAQPSPHRPCRRRDRLGGPAGAGEGRGGQPQHHADPRHGGDRPDHRPPRRGILDISGAVHGLYAYNKATEAVDTLTARATILATGGAGRTYLFSTAPRGATGDGIAMAWRAGCRISNMEFMQFHPTCLYNLEVKNFLITEAVRGEGGILKHPDTGHRFMPDYDERGELAPRDVVARAIDHEIKRDGLDYVHLDISHREPEFVKEHFPNIYEKLIGLGIDITKEPIPVVPAQHYTCGGVVVDIDGRTDAPCLYAAGEVTQSGLHGANRLASNSLLECLVFGEARGQAYPRPLGRSCRAAGDPGVGRKPGDRQRRGSGDPADAGARSAASCGISSASSGPPSGWSGPSGGSTCCARKSATITAISG